MPRRWQLCFVWKSPPCCSTGSQVENQPAREGLGRVSESELGDTYEGNLAAKVASAGFLGLVTGSQLVVDKQATPSGSGCLKVSATT